MNWPSHYSAWWKDLWWMVIGAWNDGPQCFMEPVNIHSWEVMWISVKDLHWRKLLIIIIIIISVLAFYYYFGTSILLLFWYGHFVIILVLEFYYYYTNHQFFYNSLDDYILFVRSHVNFSERSSLKKAPHYYYYFGTGILLLFW